MASNIKKDEIRSNEEGKVLISKEAFRNIITHILRFGNEALENSVEVVGICIGKSASNEKDILLINAIPITHGKNVSLGFSEEDYAKFDKINERYESQNLHIVGWYHSHPGWGLFFSDIAIKNHHYFQTEENTNGFSIVFDHTLMGKDENLGFEIFRLNNYEDLMAMEYHNVEFELEPPNTLEYFKWVQKFVEDIQKKTPILIKEINEVIEPTPTDLQEIPIPEELEEKKLKKEEYPDITPIISGFQEGASKFAETFMGTLKSQLGDWTKDINQGSLNGTGHILNSLKQMKDKVSFGLSKVQNWFERNLDDLIGNFRISVSNYIDSRIETQKGIVNQMPYSKDEIIEGLSVLIEDNFKKLIKDIESRGIYLLDNINNTAKTNSKVEELLTNTSQKVLEINDKANKMANEISQHIMTTLSPFEQNLMNKIDALSIILNSYKENYSKTNEKLQKLRKIAENLKKF